MIIATAKFVCLFLSAVFFLAACRAGENQNQNSQPANSAPTADGENGNSDLPKDDIEELEKIIKLPFHPEEAVWRADDARAATANNLPAQSRKKLVAVLRFSPQDANQIVSQAERYKPAAATEIEAENWFPAELIAQSQLSGDESLKGSSYAANDFFLAPFNDGKLTRIIDTNYFVLELSAS